MTTKANALPMVTFHLMREFLDELARDKENVHRQIVRVTKVYRRDKTAPILCHLFVVATARVEDYVVKMESYVGQVWDPGGEQRDPVSQDTNARGEQLMVRLKKALRDMGMEIRSGVWEGEE